MTDMPGNRGYIDGIPNKLWAKRYPPGPNEVFARLDVKSEYFEGGTEYIHAKTVERLWKENDKLREQVANLEGYRDHKNLNLGKGANPYSFDTKGYWAWLEGWERGP